MKKGNVWALLPIGIFVALYLGLGITFEYILKIPMGFYKVPIVVIFLVSLLVACLQNRGVSFEKKLTLMGQGVGDKNIITMLLIFLLAGIFVGVVGRNSAESVAYFLLSIVPPKFAVCILFIVSCFVSTAMGTSVGTITLITPIAAAISVTSGFSLSLCVGTVVGGAMFGDNLSFVSDTTIAACNGQGCAMKDKFRTNFAIVLPAAIVTFILILVTSLQADIQPLETKAYDLIQIIPYVLVLIGGINHVIALFNFLQQLAHLVGRSLAVIVKANNDVALAVAHAAHQSCVLAEVLGKVNGGDVAVCFCQCGNGLKGVVGRAVVYKDYLIVVALKLAHGAFYLLRHGADAVFRAVAGNNKGNKFHSYASSLILAIKIISVNSPSSFTMSMKMPSTANPARS